MQTEDTGKLLEDVRRQAHEGNSEQVVIRLRTLLRETTLTPAQYGIVNGVAGELAENKHNAALKIAVVGSITTQPIVTAVRCALLAEGLLAQVYEAPFASYLQEIISPDSELYRFQPDLVVVATDFSDTGIQLEAPMTREEAERALEAQIDRWRDVWGLLEANLNKPVLQHLCELPETEFLGTAERRVSWSPARLMDLLNFRLVEEAPGFVTWIDVDRLAQRVGRQNWHDMRLYHHGKFGFSPRYLPQYIALLSAALRAVLGKQKKALILDLDNTLWGGVVGDDGLDGILLGPDTPTGEAHQQFCRYVKALGQRGVILGICSKNEYSIATEVFEKHSHMPLDLDDFAVINCNWDDKASNLAMIAEELNIDISALVFVDDNPAECELVRQTLPEVLTVHMDGDPAVFVRKLDHLHLFDTTVFSNTDRARAESYRARVSAARLKSSIADVETYLRSLEMHGDVWKAGHEDLARLAQMEGKTNQFNLTTRRWTSGQIENFIAKQDHEVLCFKLVDRFADHGLVGSMVVSYLETEVRILSWLLSCRVFSRTCEDFMLSALLDRARRRGIDRIVGEYIETEKNQVVSGLFERLGFKREQGGNVFTLELAASKKPETYVQERN